MTLSVVSLFSGGGGLDLGFEKAGFKIVWANDYDKQVIKTYKKNNPNVLIDDRSLDKIKSDEIPSSDGVIGGLPCQSWSIAGSNKGLKDKRGKVFLEYLRIINDKNPKFFGLGVNKELFQTYSIDRSYHFTRRFKIAPV